MATKKTEVEEEFPEETAPPRIQHDFMREDLNELRDAVNELHARG